MAGPTVTLEPIGIRLETSEERVDALFDVIQRAVLMDDYEIDRNALAYAIGMLDDEQKAMRALWEEYVKAEVASARLGAEAGASP